MSLPEATVGNVDVVDEVVLGPLYAIEAYDLDNIPYRDVTMSLHSRGYCLGQGLDCAEEF